MLKKAEIPGVGCLFLRLKNIFCSSLANDLTYLTYDIIAKNIFCSSLANDLTYLTYDIIAKNKQTNKKSWVRIVRDRESVRALAVSLSLLVTIRTIPIKSHQHDGPVMNWTRKTPTNMSNWTGKNT